MATANYHEISALIPPFTGGLSIFGSYVILRELYAEKETDQASRPAVSRAIASMAIADIIYSVALSFSTFLSPDGANGMPYTYGNIGSCEFQGFLAFFGGLASPFFTTLTIFYFMVILKYRWTDDQLAKHGKLIHCSIWLFSLVMSLIPIPLDFYNNVHHVCWLNSSPMRCRFFDFLECERGEEYYYYAQIFTYFPVVPAIFLTIVFMLIIWREVRSIEEKISRYGSSTLTPSDGVISDITDNVDRRRSTTVAVQASLYCLAFVATQILRIFAVLWLEIALGYNEILYIVAFDIMLPLQGLLNMCVFIRNRKPETPEGILAKRVMCCCGSFSSLGGSRKGKLREERKRDSSVSKDRDDIKDEQPNSRVSEALLAEGQVAIEQSSSSGADDAQVTFGIIVDDPKNVDTNNGAAAVSQNIDTPAKHEIPQRKLVRSGGDGGPLSSRKILSKTAIEGFMDDVDTSFRLRSHKAKGR